jgi:hypothetical protein
MSAPTFTYLKPKKDVMKSINFNSENTRMGILIDVAVDIRDEIRALRQQLADKATAS